jgi:hypothetical protein
VTDNNLRVPGAARAEDVLPPRYTSTLQALASAAAEEPAGIVTKDNAAEEIQRLLKDADRRRGTIAVALGVLGTGTNTAKERASAARLASHAEQELTHIGDRLRTALRAVGLLIPALLVAVGLTVGGPSVGHAEAAEGPQPDPVAAVASQTVRVTLGAAPVTAWVRASVYTPVGAGLVVRLGVVGSRSHRRHLLHRAHVPDPGQDRPPHLPGRPHLRPGRRRRHGRRRQQRHDRRTPALPVRRGDLDADQYGDGLTVSARLYAYTPALGAWTPQQASPVKVQELRAGRWVTIAATTNRRGRFLITVITGGGPRTLRVHRDTGATVAATNGTARHFYLYPTDVPDGTV